VYLNGSTALAVLMKTVGRDLASASTPTWLIYQQSSGSCEGVHGAFDLPSPPLGGDFFYYEPGDALMNAGANKGLPCHIDPLDGLVADVGLSDVYPDSCADFSDRHTLPDGIADFPGPVQVMTFVVPVASSQRVISHDAAYLIYGFGANSNPVSPWT